MIYIDCIRQVKCKYNSLFLMDKQQTVGIYLISIDGDQRRARAEEKEREREGGGGKMALGMNHCDCCEHVTCVC